MSASKPAVDQTASTPSVPARRTGGHVVKPLERTVDGRLATTLNSPPRDKFFEAGQASQIAIADFTALFHSAPNEKIAAIRLGVPATAIGELSTLLKMSKDSLIEVLGFAKATVHRKAKEAKHLSRDESERVLGVQALIGQVQAMVEESGDPTDFDAARWVSDWLNTPLAALGGALPASYLDTVEGQKFIANLLAMSQSGAYA